MLPTNLDIHGLDSPLDEELHLTAGPVTCIFEPVRGYLRRIQLAGEVKPHQTNEVLQCLYLHVRGEDWSTILPKVTIVEKTVEKDHFRIVWDAHSVGPNVDFSWRGTATGSPDGTIVYRCEGQANGKTVTNRTGVCALIPATLAGHATAVVSHPDGSVTNVSLPQHVSPVEPIANASSIKLPGATLVFDGDVFGAEDQRNWTDNSFKAFSVCGGRRLYTLQPGDKVLNQVMIKPDPASFRDWEDKPSDDKLTAVKIPQIGIRVKFGDEGVDSTKGVADFLHLEIPSDLSEAERAVAWAQEEAKKNGQDLVLEFHGDLKSDTIRAALAAATRVVGFDLHGGPLGEPDRQKLGHHTITGATFFSDLNFHGRVEGTPAGIFFGAMPQIHTFDETSILDNSRTLEESTHSARILGNIAPTHSSLAISPKTDPRLASQFGAVWLLGCLAGITKGITESVAISSFSNLWLNGKPSHPVHLLAALRKLGQEGSMMIPEETSVLGNFFIFKTDKATFIGNRTRQTRKFDRTLAGEVKSLSSTGWKPKDSKEPLGAYEIVMIS